MEFEGLKKTEIKQLIEDLKREDLNEVRETEEQILNQIIL